MYFTHLNFSVIRTKNIFCFTKGFGYVKMHCTTYMPDPGTWVPTFYFVRNNWRKTMEGFLTKQVRGRGREIQRERERERKFGSGRD